MRIKLFIIVLFIFISGCGKPYIPIFEGNCVDRAVEIRQLLKSQGYEAELIVGLSPDKTEAHCWVKYKDKKTNKWVEFSNHCGVHKLDRRFR